MSTWKHLIRFLDDHGQTYLASLQAPQPASEIVNSSVTGYASFEDLLEKNGRDVKVVKVQFEKIRQQSTGSILLS